MNVGACHFKNNRAMQKIISALLSFVIVLSPGLVPAQNLSEEKNTAHATAWVQFSGRVTDAISGEPLVGASVYLADLRTGALTNKEGAFVLNNIASGRHLVEVSFVGYSTITEYVDIKADTKKDFVLSFSIIENDEVVVTGVSAATQVRRAPTPVTVMKKQELTRTVATNLIDALSRKPGIAQLGTGPAISKPIIRGLGYNRVIVMNDGVRQEGQQWGDEHGIEIDEYSVNKIEILKGPASLMYGSDAMAGVINILTNVPVAEGTFKGSIIANYQTNNRLRGIGGNVGANYATGFNWSLYGSYKAAADYRNKYDGRVYNSKFNEANFGGHAGYNGSWGYSHLVFSSFNQQAGIVEGDRDEDGNFIKPVAGGGETLATEDDFNSVNPHIPFQKIRHNKIVSDNSFNIGANRLALVVGYQNNRRMEFGNIDDPSEKELYFDLNTVTYSALMHFRERNNWRTSLGLNGMVQNNNNRGAEVLIPEYGLWDIGGFLYTQKTADKFTLSGGIRFDNRSIDSRFFEDGGDVKFDAFKKNFSNVSGSAGISYLPSKEVVLKLNVARGFRAPSIPELASNGTHEGTNRYEYGDKDLKSETSWQTDAGFEWNGRHLSVSANLFLNAINNFIFYRKLESLNGGDSLVEVDGEELTAFRFNQQDAMLTGAEIAVDIHPHPLDWLHFENSLSLVRGRFNDNIEGNNNIPFIPAARFLSDLRADVLPKGKLLRNGFIKIELEKVFDQDNAFTVYDTETPTNGYALLHAALGADIVSKKKATLFSVFFNVNNITDVAYQNHLNRLKYAAINERTGRMGVFNMGRNFSVKINVPFGR
jgi:iron complex outermembrane recepter protein